MIVVIALPSIILPIKLAETAVCCEPRKMPVQRAVPGAVTSSTPVMVLFWIVKGEKAYPVDGLTVAGNSFEMLRHVVAVGSDLEFRTSTACPTLLISEMTVSGNG